MHRAVVAMAKSLEAALAEAVGRTQWVALRKALVRLNAHVQSIEGPDHGDAVD